MTSQEERFLSEWYRHYRELFRPEVRSAGKCG
jgi:hypothetical protein